MVDGAKIGKLAKTIRYHILASTTEAGSGHPSSSLSAVELTATLMFGGYFKTDVDNHANPNNDRLIFSKGHASPLLYALWGAAGKVSEKELLSLRKFGSRLEGHPTPAFEYTEAATGSLGQGLSVGVGMALNAKLDKLPYRVFVLLGDSESSEGSVWEAIELATHYKLDNLVGMIDVNRLGQRGQTMLGHDTKKYEEMVSAFGWHTIVINGHSIKEVASAFKEAEKTKDKPVMIIAKTLKGKGVSLLEDKDNWHGKALKKEQLDEAVKELGEFDKGLTGEITKPEKLEPANPEIKEEYKEVSYEKGEMIATRKAYGNALVRIYPKYMGIVVLDAETSNSTYADIFKNAYPERFFEMFIAEQNMAGCALGFGKRGKIPFASSFSAFLTRAFDQIRMSQYSDANIKFVGSHCGVSIGADGASQMGLEDIAMFRTLLRSVVLHPSDAVSTEKLVEAAAEHRGVLYLRTVRAEVPVIYGNDEKFEIGGSKVVKKSDKDVATIVSAGITLHEAIKAGEELEKEGINVRIIDLYSVKPLDGETLLTAAKETKAIVTVEDHYAEGGLGEAVKALLCNAGTELHSLAVTKMPKSGQPNELLDYEGISAKGIVKKIKDIIK